MFYIYKQKKKNKKRKQQFLDSLYAAVFIFYAADSSTLLSLLCIRFGFDLSCFFYISFFSSKPITITQGYKTKPKE